MLLAILWSIIDFLGLTAVALLGAVVFGIIPIKVDEYLTRRGE